MTQVIWRVVRAGVAAAVSVALGGWALGVARFGRSDQGAMARVEAELRRRFDASAETLGAIAARLAAERDAIRAAPRDDAAARRLFDAVDSAVRAQESARTGLTGITIYDAAGTPAVWSGHVTEFPRDRIDGPGALFVAPGALGPELVRVEPVDDVTRAAGARLATIVVEQVLGPVQVAAGLADTFVLQTSLVPVSLRAAYGNLASGPFAFVIPDRSGSPLIEADVAPSDLHLARARWLAGTRAAVLSILAVTLLLCAGPLVELRRQTRDRRTQLIATSALALAILAVRALFWVAASPFVERTLDAPVDLLLTALALAALVWIAFDSIERWRVTPPRRHLVSLDRAQDAVRLGLAFLVAGALDAWILWGYERVLARVVSGSNLDVLHFSLHPFDATRLTVAFALVILHTAVIWTAAVLLRLTGILWRPARRWEAMVTIAGAWLIGVAVGVDLAQSLGTAVPPGSLFIALATAALCALALTQLRTIERRASQATRLGALFLVFLLPALAIYPSLVAFASEAKERLVANEYGPQAASLRDDLKIRLQRALDQIDALPSLTDFVAGSADVPTPTTDRAFVVWSQTDLKVYRLTSAIELYASEGQLVSRFALDLPEYTTPTHQASNCDWDLFDELSAFGSNQRHVLRASRGICEDGRVIGSIVVRAMVDYQTLPFMSTQSPYLESLRPDRRPPPEGEPGRDVEFVMYGWSGAPIYESGTSVWALPDGVFRRLVSSRQPFWTTLTRDGNRYRVYLLNDRGGIYALGYPLITPLGHLVNLAELTTLTVVLCAGLLGAGTLISALTLRTPAGGRALWREIRSSFYRKLFVAFLAGAVVPVVVLAIATRAYFATQFRAGIEDSAARTARVAQRLVEDYATLEHRGAGALETIDDQIMVLVGLAIDQDVNLFVRSHLQATSERDLFASKLLTTRTPSDAYRRITLDRLPTFVGVEQVGGLPYLLAAAPVRASGGEGIVTVPLTLRQSETERQIDELDRRLLFGTVVFCLFGGALGYWMAERIADPVNRLTRATRRIARGDLDARIAATSSDELRRLVQDFNQMAADLKRQRVELERTQRLEAWATMARQVAHDIKNPLTPIQLSAEHARRINLDRGRPLSPVLDECVNAILSQVKLLRQISAEFSSFASSPTPRPEVTSLPELIDEVIEPYRTGLSGRIAIELRQAPDLPPVRIDKTLFGRALTNVIENALHAMPGRGTLTIAANHESRLGGHPSVIVRVSDTGVGMDQDALKKIFEPYFSTKTTGTGLGLTIAKRNVELNGGSIVVESERGVGTTVTITLPE